VKTKLGIFVFFLLFAGNSAFSQFTPNNYYLPQVADGTYADGSFRTTFVFFNNHNNSATVLMTLTDDAGNGMTVTIPGLGTDSEFSFTLPAGATRLYQTSGLGSLKAGAATIFSTAPIGVSGIFTIFDTANNFVTESGVGSSDPLTDFVIPVQAGGNYSTGLALFNPNGDASFLAILSDANGTELARTTKDLVGGAHMAIFVTGGGQLFPNISSVQGTLTIHSPEAISAMVLRQSSSPYGLTSLPVVSTSSTQTTMSLAQVANGSYNGGSFRTSFLLFSTSSSTANVALTLTKDDGTPFPVTIPGQTPNSSTFNFTIAPGKSLFLQTDGSGSLAAGAARITSTAPIGATGIFTVYDPQGNFQTEAGVGDSPVLTQFTLPVDLTGTFDTGVAFFNPGTASVTMTFRFMNVSGENSSQSPTITLGPKEHTAQFVSQLFPGLSNVQGSLAISATGGIAALTLRQNSTPYGLTTLPVASGTATGTSAAKVLLSQVQTGVSATSNVTVNKTLPPGLRLSGIIQGGGFGFLVTAQSGSNAYSGTVDFLSGRYLVILPAGTYTVKVVFVPTAAGNQTVLMTYTHPNQVQVPADTTLNLTLPSPAMFNISGAVSGTSNIPGSGGTTDLVFTSNDNSIQGLIPITAGTGTYSGVLPAGNYLVCITADNIPSGLLIENLSVYNVGTVNVSGNTTASFAVPNLVTLSGIAGFSGVTPTSGFISATDTADLPTDPFIFLSGPRTSGVSFLTGFTGSYQMLLPQNRTYSMDVSYEPSTIAGMVSYPVTMSTVNLPGNATYNFTVPSLPVQVTVSGRVTDNSGNGVADVSVSAYTESLTGAANTAFSAGSTTDSNGNYSFNILSGTNYQMSFDPKPPTP
jgi:hypothetical protein